MRRSSMRLRIAGGIGLWLVSLLPPALPVAAGGDWTAVFSVATPEYVQTARGPQVTEYSSEDRPGAPALPVWHTLIELPCAGDWQLAVESTGDRTLRAGGAVAAVPAPALDLRSPQGVTMADGPDTVPVRDRPDPAIYGQDAFYPAEPVTVGPVQWQRGRRLLPIHVYPFQYNPVAGLLFYHPDLKITVRLRPAAAASSGECPGALAPGAPAAPASPSPAPPAADRLRIRTGERGLYRLTYDDLARAGTPVTTTKPAALAMSYLDQPIDIEVTGAGDGRFDPGDLVIFYAEPYQGRYMTQNVYWLSTDGAAGARMAARDVSAPGIEPVVTTITRTLHVEVDRSYYSTYTDLPADADHFFDAPLYANNITRAASVTYDLPLLDPVSAGDVTLRAALHGGADRVENPDQSVALQLNGRPAVLAQWNGSVMVVATATFPAAWLTPGSNRVTLTAALDQLPTLDSYWVSPNWLEANYPALARAADDRLVVAAVAPGPKSLVATGFTTSTVRGYDVSDARHPVQLSGISAQPDNAGYTIRIGETDGSAHSYELSTVAALRTPTAVEADPASAWRTPDHDADYIAIVHRSLWDAVQPLLDHRIAEGLAVAKVDVQDVYDEFSAGRVDPEAIRAFLAYAYHQWNHGAEPPQYVLLVGDGHFDFKGALRPELPNLIPPYLLSIDPWIGETAADNRYASIDGAEDYLPDMAIGRIPAKIPADVTAAVKKIIAYETAAPAGEWQRRAIFVADDYADPDGNFHALSDAVRQQSLPSGYRSQAIYYRMDAGLDSGPEMRTAIRNAFNDGALFIQWYGHASRARWGSISMFDLLDPATLAPHTELPATFSYTCWSGYFINVVGSRQYNYNEQALGEALLLAPGRGSVADLSPSGLHLGAALLTLNRGVVEAITQARMARVGLAVNAGKTYFFAHSTAWHDVIDTTVLFGDPATRLRLPPARTYLPSVGGEQR